MATTKTPDTLRRILDATVQRRRPDVLAGVQRGGATDPRQPQLGPSHRRDRRLRLARNAHTGMSALRATARGARVDSAQSAGKAARSRTDRLIRRSYA
ncbi:hypothetical protein SHIRM173S_12790 [Streptomyces hirsutus]